MTTAIITLVLDSLLAILLVATIVYCGKLNRRVRVLQDSRGELATLVAQFNQTTEKATATIEELKSTSKKIVEQMQVKINKANYLADDLSFIIEKGEKIANNLEGEISHARGMNKPASPAAAQFTGSVIPPRKPREAAPQTGAESRSNLRPEVKPAATPASSSPNKKPESSAATAVDAALARISKRGTTPAAAGSGKSGISARIRTQAERELMDALKQQH